MDELVDWSNFSRMRTQLGASFVRILGYFREDGEKAVCRIEEAMHRQDASGLILPAHTLKAEARTRGLWNLFQPHAGFWGDGFSNLDYAPLAEIMGRSPIASEALASSVTQRRKPSPDAVCDTPHTSTAGHLSGIRSACRLTRSLPGDRLGGLPGWAARQAGQGARVGRRSVGVS